MGREGATSVNQGGDPVSRGSRRYRKKIWRLVGMNAVHPKAGQITKSGITHSVYTSKAAHIVDAGLFE